MSATVSTFDYHGEQVRTLTGEDGEPRFVVSDLAKLLGYRDAANAARLLREHQQGYAEVSTPGGTQRVLACTEGGMNRLVMRSNATNAEAVQDWLADEVMVVIRRTGSYGVSAVPTPLVIPTSRELAALVIAEADRADAAEAQVAELTPRAVVADRLLDAAGDLSVGDAALALSRAGVLTGRTRLFRELDERAWIHRQSGHWAPYARTVECGWLTTAATSYWDQAREERIVGDPQVRITPKGLQRLLLVLDQGGLALAQVGGQR